MTLSARRRHEATQVDVAISRRRPLQDENGVRARGEEELEEETTTHQRWAVARSQLSPTAGQARQVEPAGGGDSSVSRRRSDGEKEEGTVHAPSRTVPTRHSSKQPRSYKMLSPMQERAPCQSHVSTR